MTGVNSKYVEDSELIHKEVKRFCKINHQYNSFPDVPWPVQHHQGGRHIWASHWGSSQSGWGCSAFLPGEDDRDAPHHMMIIFLQGVGLLPSVARKFSRQPSLVSQASLEGERLVRPDFLFIYFLFSFSSRKNSQIDSISSALHRFSVPELDATKLPEVSCNFEQVIMG